MHNLRRMGSKFCAKLQRTSLKFHTKFFTHTPQNRHFICFNFCVWFSIYFNCDVIGPSEKAPCSLTPSVLPGIMHMVRKCVLSQIARFVGPTWGPPGADRTQVGPMLAPWILLSGLLLLWSATDQIYPHSSGLLHGHWGNHKIFLSYTSEGTLSNMVDKCRKSPKCWWYYPKQNKVLENVKTYYDTSLSGYKFETDKKSEPPI